MSFKYKSGGQVSDSVGLLVSILVRYPEVGTINVDQEEQLLKLTFFVANDISELDSYSVRLYDSLKLFNQLEGRSCRVCEIDLHHEESVVTIEVKRDIESFSQNELNLIVELLEQLFADFLVTDQSEDIPEEELQMQEELIRHMLENLRGKRPDKSIVALREEGRVLVYNK